MGGDIFKHGPLTIQIQMNAYRRLRGHTKFMHNAYKFMAIVVTDINKSLLAKPRTMIIHDVHK